MESGPGWAHRVESTGIFKDRTRFQRGCLLVCPACRSGTVGKGPLCPGDQALAGNPHSVPGPAAVNLAGHDTFSQLCSDHLSFAPNGNVLAIHFSL